MLHLETGQYYLAESGDYLFSIDDVWFDYVKERKFVDITCHTSSSGVSWENTLSEAEFFSMRVDKLTLISSAKGKMLCKLWSKSVDYGYWPNN